MNRERPGPPYFTSAELERRRKDLELEQQRKVEEIQSLLLDEQGLKEMLIEPYRTDNRARVQKALKYLYTLGEHFAANETSLHLTAPATLLSEQGIIPNEAHERLKTKDENSLIISMRDGIVTYVEEYTRRRTSKVIFGAAEGSEATLLKDRVMRKTFTVTKITEEGRELYVLELLDFYSPSVHIHFVPDITVPGFEGIAGLPLANRERKQYENNRINYDDINRLLAISYHGGLKKRG